MQRELSALDFALDLTLKNPAIAIRVLSPTGHGLSTWARGEEVNDRLLPTLEVHGANPQDPVVYGDARNLELSLFLVGSWDSDEEVFTPGPNAPMTFRELVDWSKTL